jgi:hypothetical protein
MLNFTITTIITTTIIIIISVIRIPVGIREIDKWAEMYVT